MAEGNSEQVLRITDHRLSYFYGFDGYKDDEDPTKVSYPCHFLMLPTHPDVPRIVAAMKAAARGLWKEDGEKIYEQLKAQHRLCLHEGDVSKPGADGYSGMLFLSGNARKRYTIVDADRTPLTAADGRPYSGCRGNAIVGIWAQQHPKFGRRINCQIQGIQFTKHGDRFGGGRVAQADEFDVVANDTDGDVPNAAGAAAGLF